MRICLALAAIAVATPPAAAQSWRSVSISPRSISFVDDASIHRQGSGPLVSLTTMMVFATPRPDGTVAQQVFWHVYCPESSVSFGTIVSYSAALAETNRDMTWRNEKVAPGSVMMAMVDYACTGKVRSDSRVFASRAAAVAYAQAELRRTSPAQ